MSAAQQMQDRFQVAADVCTCGTEIWFNEEDETYEDTRFITNVGGGPTFECLNGDMHEPA